MHIKIINLINRNRTITDQKDTEKGKGKSKELFVSFFPDLITFS